MKKQSNYSRMQVIIPMSGTGERFKKAGYQLPKPLIEVDGKPIIQHLVDRFPKNSRYVFICNSDHLKNTQMRQILTKLAEDVTIVEIQPHKLGPTHAVLEAQNQIDDQLPTIVNYCDFSFTWDSEHFLSWTHHHNVDGAIVCYRGFHPHYFGPTNYAYCRTNSFGKVLEVREKQNFTEDRTKEFASSGTYYFKSGSLVKKYFHKNKTSGQSLNSEFYVSLVYNHLAQDQLDVRVYEIDTFLQWGTPEDLEDWQYWKNAFESFPYNRSNESNHAVSPQTSKAILLMPMAGLGSRFHAGGIPKPLIPLHEKPLFSSACNFLPKVSKRVFIVRKEIEKEVRASLEKDDQLVVLQEPTDGQATTCGMALPLLDQLPEGPLWISSCDHGVALDQTHMNQIEQSGCDLGIVGVRGYPGARRSPRSYAFNQTEKDQSQSNPLLRIHNVSVKTPVSDYPSRDSVLIGTFYFRSKNQFSELLRKLLEKNIRVNGERYLDCIVNLAIEEGLNVREINSKGYYCWGTPDALDEYKYWHRYFQGIEA